MPSQTDGIFDFILSFYLLYLGKAERMVAASQALKMYELLNKYFRNSEDAKVIVASIEDIVDNKFNNEKDRLATKQDIFSFREETKKEIFSFREETKKEIFELREDVLALQIRVEQGFKDQLKWLIVLMVGLSSLAVAIIKLT